MPKVQPNPPHPSIYWQLAKFLYERIDRAKTPGELDQLGTILDLEIRDLLDAKCEGIGYNLWLWLGLKDPPSGNRQMARDFKIPIKKTLDKYIKVSQESP